MKLDARTVVIAGLVLVIVIAWSIFCTKIGAPAGMYIWLLGVLVGAILALIHIDQFLPRKIEKPKPKQERETPRDQSATAAQDSTPGRTR